MKAVIATALAIALVLFGCSGAQSSAKTPAAARAEARAAVETLETAWLTTGQACVDLAEAKGDETVLKACAKALTPARNDLLAASETVDAWTTATSDAALACKLAGVLTAVESVEALGIPMASVVKDAEVLMAPLMGACVDGGAK